MIENMYSLPFLPLKAPRWHFFQLNTFSKDTKGKRRFGAFKARIGEKCMFYNCFYIKLVSVTYGLSFEDLPGHQPGVVDGARANSSGHISKTVPFLEVITTNTC